jgi:hypothetical protein
MIDKVQIIAKATGESGCYALTGLKIAERGGHALPSLETIAAEMAKGNLGSDCFLKDPDAYFSDLFGEPMEVIKAGPGHPLPLDYKLQPNEAEALRFERPGEKPGDEPLAHFVEGAGDGKTVSWDPWPGSRTVRDGKLVSRRIIRRKN